MCKLNARLSRSSGASPALTGWHGFSVCIVGEPIQAAGIKIDSHLTSASSRSNARHKQGRKPGESLIAQHSKAYFSAIEAVLAAVYTDDTV